MNNYIEIAKDVLKRESDSLQKLVGMINESFVKAIELLLNTDGKVIVTGVGKSGHIGSKIAASLSSTGTSSFILNPSEGIHGDLGVVMEGDCIIALSKTGETKELLNILPYPKRIGVPIISITSGKDSTLDDLSDVTLLIPDDGEVCPMGLAPTTSTTLTLALGDAIVVALMKAKGFNEEQFAVFHPGGQLGRKLLKVKDMMIPKSKLAIINKDKKMKEVLKEFVTTNKGMCIYINNNKLQGILSDGDMKRKLLEFENLLEKKFSEVMIKNPTTINKNKFALEALNIMEEKSFTWLLVNDEKNEFCGIIHIHDILKGKLV